MTERTDLFVSGPVPMFSSGNEAIAEGALAAGARFYAGYPITPSSEVAEAAARRMPSTSSCRRSPATAFRIARRAAGPCRASPPHGSC